MNTTAIKQPHLPGEVGVWVFILGDMTVFALFFATFTFYRAKEVALFSASQAHLNANFGAVNTLLLLTSSWFVATGVVKAIRRDQAKLASRLFTVAALCGAGFGVVKFFEYGEKIRAGITLTTNDFYMYYFVLTGIHFLHLLLGMGVLILMILKSRGAPAGGPSRVLIEGGACYWHMVDLLWIVLFPLLYLIK